MVTTGDPDHLKQPHRRAVRSACIAWVLQSLTRLPSMVVGNALATCRWNGRFFGHRENQGLYWMNRFIPKNTLKNILGEE